MLTSNGSRQSDLRRLVSAAAAVAAFVIADGTRTMAVAQGMPDSRVAVTLSGAYQVNETSFSQTVTFELYSEDGSVTTDYTVARQPVFDAGVVVRVWRNFGMGLSGSHVSDSNSALVNALIPHPLEFGQPRSVSGPAEVSHTETAMHLEAAYWIQQGAHLEIIVSGGPSVFRVDQDFVSEVTFSQAPPYDVATYGGATLVSERKTAYGWNVGGEAGWRLARHFGIAATVRYSHATADFAGTSAQPVVVGGLHVGAGVHLLF